MQHNSKRALGLPALAAAMGLLLLLPTVPASAQLSVPGDHDTIQAAIDAAAAGETINVAAGVYSESLVWIGKQLILQGAGPGETILDPSLGPGGRGMLAEDLPEGSALRGFTFRNGSAFSEGGGLRLASGTLAVEECEFTGNSGGFHGGAIFNNGELTVTNSTFTENSTGLDSGAIANFLGVTTVTNSSFTDNSAVVGGAIGNTGELTVTNSSFTGNSAVFEGGAIVNTGELTVTNGSFTGNSGGAGGGAIINTGELTVTNGSFIGNSASDGGGIANTRVLTVTNSTFAGNSGGILSGGGSAAVELRNSILRGNGAEEVSREFGSGTFAVAHSNVQGGLPVGVDDLGGNIDVDPLFVRDPFTNGPDDFGDLRLQEGSPSIDAGNDAFVTVPPFPTDEFANPVDLDGNPRSVGNAVDMGAYEFQGAADHDPCDPAAVEALRAKVVALVAAGARLPGNGQPLLAKLDAAIRHLTECQKEPARGVLGAFSNQVRALARTGWLAPATAAEWIADAQAISAELSAE